MKNKFDNKGITLITLVITIVVLLIVGGAVISLTSGGKIIDITEDQKDNIDQELALKNESMQNHLDFLYNVSGGTTHICNYVEDPEKKEEPTCTENGYRVYVCTYPGCDKTRKEIIEKEPHNYNIHGYCIYCNEYNSEYDDEANNNRKSYI